MSSCLPWSKLRPEVKLLNDCYPPPKQLVQSGPDYRPLSQDLSKLTYSCRNRSSYLPKVGEELEKRVAKETTRSTGGYPKSRSSLLISLAILKALIVECKTDLSLFARSVIRIVHSSLDVKVYGQGGSDLEVVGRAASSFIAFSTYTDGSAIFSDSTVHSTYMSVLRKFAVMAVSTGSTHTEKSDEEVKNRTRLIALAALHGAAGSDTMFSSTSEFPKQVDILLPALLTNIAEGSSSQLKLETAKIEMDASPSPFFTEFSARRPVNDRRAPSLHAHIPGEKGPEGSDVLSAALRTLHDLVDQCHTSQTSHVLDAVFAFLDRKGWNDVEWCCWLAERLTGFTMLQYRFVVPTRLAEALVDLPDAQPTHKHMTLLSMLTTILNSNISLVGLGVSDLLNNLTTLITRRIRLHQEDALLPPLVQCVASLGTHIYYADQINDIVEEIAIRMSEVPATDKARPEILRVLILCIIGVMTTARTADEAEALRAPTPEPGHDKGKGVAVETPLEPPRRETTRRNPISPEVWQETIPLLCESTFAVRSVYVRALLLFLQNEMPRDSKTSRPGNLVAYRFCNALHAAIYTLAMSCCLGSDTSSPSVNLDEPSPPHTSKPVDGHVDASPTVSESKEKHEKGVSFNVTEPTPSATPNSLGNGTGASTPPRKASRSLRRVSLPLQRLNSSATLTSFDNVATPFDFAAILKILDDLHAILPVSALLSGAPMLLALDADAGNELIRTPGDGRSGAWVLERRRAIRETVVFIWRRIGDRWNISEISSLTNRTLEGMPEPFIVPTYQPPADISLLPPPEEPASFFQHDIEGESSSAARPLLDREVIINALVGSNTVQTSTGRDAPTLARRFGSKWTVEAALKDSVERFSSAQIRQIEDPHFDIANVLMNIDNSSYQSFGRPQAKAVDVTDLRLALDGRVDTMSSAPSIRSTTSRGTPQMDSQSARRANAHTKVNGSAVVGGGPSGTGHSTDVKNVLKEIFKDKKKGRRSNVAEGAMMSDPPTTTSQPVSSEQSQPAKSEPYQSAEGAGTQTISAEGPSSSFEAVPKDVAGVGNANGANGLLNGFALGEVIPARKEGAAVA